MTAEQVARYRHRGVLPDSNLLLLFFVGALGRSAIRGFKRTSRYSVADYELLVGALSYFSHVVTTPHLLTEVSNLAGQLTGESRAAFFEEFAKGITLMDEEHAAAVDLACEPAFAHFGISDAAILERARERYLVLTEDFRLADFLARAGVDVLNFNHLRLYRYFS